MNLLQEDGFLISSSRKKRDIFLGRGDKMGKMVKKKVRFLGILDQKNWEFEHVEVYECLREYGRADFEEKIRAKFY